MKKYNWATLGCGVIANELAAAMEKKGEKLYSVANRTHEKAVQFAEKYGIDCIGIWMESIGQCMYLKKMVFCVDIIHFCYKEMENVNLIILQYCQSIDIRALEDNY